MTVVVLSFTPYLLNSFCNEPSMDDYRYAANYQAAEFWTLQKQMYEKWCGRYTATALLYLGPLSFDSFPAYRLAAPLLLGLLLGSVYFVAWPLLAWMSGIQRHLAILLPFSIWISCLPSLAQGIYWFTGAYTYLPAVVLFNLFLGMLFRLRGFSLKDLQWEPNSPGHEALFVVAGLGLMGLAVGLNEMIVVCGFPILLALNLAAWKKTGRPDFALLGVTLGSLVFVLVSFLAPGNAARSEAFEKSKDLVLTLWKGPAYLVWFGQYFLSLPLVVAGLALIRPLAELAGKLPKELYGGPARWMVLGLALLLPLAVFTLGVWATGARPARRAINVLHYYEFVLVALAWCQWVLARPEFFQRCRARIPGTDGLLLTLAAVCLLVSGNQREAWRDLFQRAPAYRHEMKERYARIGRGGDVVVAPIVSKPKTLFFEDITEDPGNWQNVEMARYFGVSSIRLSEKDVRHPLRE